MLFNTRLARVSAREAEGDSDEHLDMRVMLV